MSLKYTDFGTIEAVSVNGEELIADASYSLILSWHRNALLCFSLYHRRVFLSLSVFYGSVHS